MIGHSRGTNAAMEVLLRAPNFSSNYLLSCPFWMQIPGKKSRDTMIPIHHGPRAGKLAKVLKEHHDIRFLLMLASEDIYREVGMCFAFWMRGNCGDRVTVLDEHATHDDPIQRVFGIDGQSRLCKIIKQIDEEILNSYDNAAAKLL